MPNRGSSVFVLISTVVVFGLVIAGIFAAVQLIERMQGPHVPSGWAFVEYTIEGNLDESERRAVAKSVVFRMHMGRAADARWWTERDKVTVAVPEAERDELEALPSSGPQLDFGGVITSGSVGDGKITDQKMCQQPPANYACDRDRNYWYQLSEPALTGKDIAKSKVVEDKAGTGAYAVEMTLDAEAEEKLSSTTKRMEQASGDGRRLAVVYGGIVLSAEPVKEPITDGVVRLAGFAKPEAADLSGAVRASKYDVTLNKGDVQIAE